MDMMNTARIWLSVAAGLALAFCLSACGKKVGTDSFFPLNEGRSWDYRVTKKLSDDSDPQIDRLNFTARGQQTLDSGPAMRRHSDNGVDYWLRSDDSGIYRVASKNPLENDPKADNPPRYVLRKPFVIGTQWEASTVAYVLQRRNEVPKEIRYTQKPVMMTFRIDALAEKIETPAGKFDGCIRVAGEAKIKLYVDAQFAWRDIPLFSTEWYCPGVGLVRMERVETSPSKFMIGGSMSLELTSWND
jgi:hypothetical protein